MRAARPRVLRTALVAAAAVAGTVATGAAASAGVTGPAFYVDGALYRTVATPTDLSRTGAPAHSFDTIYDFGGAQPNVATAAPGDRDYNGGRWTVRALAFADYAAALAAFDANGSGAFDSVEEVAAALTAGAAMDLGIVKRFVCPAIPLPGSSA